MQVVYLNNISNYYSKNNTQYSEVRNLLYPVMCLSVKYYDIYKYI